MGESMKITDEEINQFQSIVLSFYKAHRRDLPWRKTTDPYKILISELMLQQTQVSRVIKYYEKWIKQWPTIDSLAQASRRDVLKAWMGLGYNTRGVNLHRAAQKIVNDYDGDMLEAMKNYKEIPGVGKYTSRAVQIFATNADIVTVDTNIRRIFIHEFHLSEDVSDSELWLLAKRCLPKGLSREWHNALMDYGALNLTAKKTRVKPKTKQSRFEGSDRQIRAQILRQLLERSLSLSDLQKILEVEQNRLQRILDKMVQENLIAVKNKRFQVKE